MMILGLTGVILLNNYTPAAPQAYLNILELRSNWCVIYITGRPTC
jgi:hypothetical protein